MRTVGLSVSQLKDRVCDTWFNSGLKQDCIKLVNLKLVICSN